MALLVSSAVLLSLGGCFPGQFPVPEEKKKPLVSPKGNSSASPFGSGAAAPTLADAGVGD